jgi:hypothetical protein
VVTDQRVRRLMRYLKDGNPLIRAAVRTGMSEPTAHTWRTRPHPYEKVLSEVKAIWTALNERHAGQFSVAQLRTLQRRVHAWRVKSGPAREVFFPRVHRPNEQAQSDFTDMRELAIRIAGEPFAHLLYHFVLTHSNWEAVMICPSESFESCVRFLRRIPKQRTDLATRYARGPRSVWPLAVVFAALRLRRRTGKAPERFRMEKRRSASKGGQVIIVEGDYPKEMMAVSGILCETVRLMC